MKRGARKRVEVLSIVSWENYIFIFIDCLIFVCRYRSREFPPSQEVALSPLTLMVSDLFGWHSGLVAALVGSSEQILLFLVAIEICWANSSQAAKISYVTERPGIAQLSLASPANSEHASTNVPAVTLASLARATMFVISLWQVHTYG
jgi:hypothetical protein